MKVIVRDLRNGNWYWIARVIYQEYSSKIGAIGLAVYNGYASYAFGEQKVFPSQSKIAEKLDISRQTLIKYNKILQQNGLIGIEKQQGCSNIITLLRIEPVKQIDRGVNDVDGGCQTDLHPPVKQIDTNKNKVNKNISNNNITTTTMFDTFWKAYPKKVSKGYARKVFNQIKPSEELLDKMLSAIAEQVGAEQWMKDNGRYIPNPATWLNGERWEDEQGVINEEKRQRTDDKRDNQRSPEPFIR